MKWILIIIGLVATLGIGLLFITDENVTWDTFKPKSFNPIWEQATLGLELNDSQYDIEHDGIDYYFYEDGSVDFIKKGERLSNFYLDLESTQMNRSSKGFAWTWRYRNYTVREIIDYDERNNPIYTYHTVWEYIGYNLHPSFNWTQKWVFFPYRSAKIEHRLTNSLGITLSNTEFFYVNDLFGNRNIIVKPDVNAIDFGGFEFRYGDLMKNNYSLNTAESDDNSFRIGVTRPSLNVNNGEVIILDPEITDYKLPTRYGIHDDDWNNGNLMLLDDGNFADATVGDIDAETVSNFTLDIPMSADIEGIEIRAGGKKAGGGGCQWVVGSIQVSGDNGTTYSSLKTHSYTIVTEQVKVYGTPSDLWGVSWVDNNFTNDNFVVRIVQTGSRGFGCTRLDIDSIETRVHFERVSGEPPNVTIDFPTENEVIGGFNFTIVANISDQEMNLLDFWLYGCDNETVSNECLLSRNIGIMGSFINFTYNWTSPLIHSNSGSDIVLLLHLNNQSEFGEDGKVRSFNTGAMRNFGSVGGFCNGSNLGDQVADMTFGKFGSGYTFDGDEDKIACGNNSDYFDLCVGGCSASAWVYRKDNSVNTVAIAKWGDLGDSFFRLGVLGAFKNRTIFTVNKNGSSGMSCTSDVARTVDGSFKNNQWNMITGVYNEAENFTRVYLNGNIMNTSTCNFDAVDPTEWVKSSRKMHIGDHDGTGTHGWNGTIDELVVWNRTLTDCEVKKLYNLNPGVSYNWRINVTDRNSSTQSVLRQNNISTCNYLCGNWDVDAVESCEITENTIIDEGSDCICEDGGIWTILGANITGWDRFIVRNGCKVHLMNGAKIVP